MSDTLIAILILPCLIALTFAMECTRIGCTKLTRRARQRRPNAGVPGASRVRA